MQDFPNCNVGKFPFDEAANPNSQTATVRTPFLFFTGHGLDF